MPRDCKARIVENSYTQAAVEALSARKRLNSLESPPPVRQLLMFITDIADNHIMTTKAALALLAVISVSAQAIASPITGLFNTGVNDAGAALSGGNGVADPH